MATSMMRLEDRSSQATLGRGPRTSPQSSDSTRCTCKPPPWLAGHGRARRDHRTTGTLLTTIIRACDRESDYYFQHVCESPRSPFRITVSGPCCELRCITKGTRPPSQPTLHHGNSASHLASSNTDTRTPAVRPRVTLIAPFCYALPHAYPAQHRSTSIITGPNAPSQPTLTPSVHASCNRCLQCTHLRHSSSRDPVSTETAANVASKTSCKLAVCTVPRPEQPLTAGADRLPGVSTVALD